MDWLTKAHLATARRDYGLLRVLWAILTASKEW
jgi:hypothetical protein